jgi:hypothetical protein
MGVEWAKVARRVWDMGYNVYLDNLQGYQQRQWKRCDRIDCATFSIFVLDLGYRQRETERRNTATGTFHLYSVPRYLVCTTSTARRSHVKRNMRYLVKVPPCSGQDSMYERRTSDIRCRLCRAQTVCHSHQTIVSTQPTRKKRHT